MFLQTQKLFLTGFMGCGKSYWGKVWADELKINFVELDTLIEIQQGMSIAGIFEQKGEAYFRAVESSVLKNYRYSDNCIISTGGGAPCFFDNMQWMNENGASIYLKASPQELARRLQNEKDKRPLIKDVPAAELENFIAVKLAGRESFYNQAKIILSTHQLSNHTLSNITL